VKQYDDLLNGDNPNQFFSYLAGLNQDQMMEITYRALVEKKMGALQKGNVPRETQIEALDILIKWFETREEYEKCHNLKKIIETL
jgi:hypothetical protein